MGKVIGALLIVVFVAFAIFEVFGIISDIKKKKTLKNKQKLDLEDPEISEVTISSTNDDTLSEIDHSDTVNKK